MENKIPKNVSQYMKEIGSRGGKNRVKNNPPEKLKEWGAMRHSKNETGEKSPKASELFY